jgi:hypothetical protein
MSFFTEHLKSVHFENNDIISGHFEENDISRVPSGILAAVFVVKSDILTVLVATSQSIFSTHIFLRSDYTI